MLDKVVENKTSIKRALANINDNSIKYAKGKDLKVTLEVVEEGVDKERARETNIKTSSNRTHNTEQYDEQENKSNKVTK